MTRARIMRVNSRQKRVNQIRASFVKDARRQMRVDTRSLAGAVSGDQDGAGDEEDGRGDQQQHVADVQEPEEGG